MPAACSATDCTPALEGLAVVGHLYNEAKFVQKWHGHANTHCRGGSGLDYHAGMCADATDATIRLRDHSDYALCLCDEFY